NTCKDAVCTFALMGQGPFLSLIKSVGSTQRLKTVSEVRTSLLLSTFLLAPTARWAAADPLRKARTQATQQAQVNEFHQREQLEHLNRAQELNETQRQLDQLRHLEASRPGLAAQPRAQQLNETQRQLDQFQLEH